jgi:acyl-CoA synthetase (AMP-forming)/AMP-acid ligase II
MDDPKNRAIAANLWARWLGNAELDPDRTAIVHWVDDRPARRWTRGELIRESLRAAAWLQDKGVRPGDVCALIIRHHPQFYPLYLGVVKLAAIPAVLAYPNPRIHPDKFVDSLVGMSQRSGLDWVLTERELEPVVGGLVSRTGSSVSGVLLPLEHPWPAPPASAAEPVLVDPASPCLLQHSSGTTGLQKGVLLSHEAVLGHVEAYAESLALQPTDCIISWLPLYHDMGMIAAFQMPLAMGVPLVQMDPFQWVSAPGIMLDAITMEGGTLAWLPNFAFNILASRMHEEEFSRIRLDGMRMFINCSEPVRAESILRFLEHFEPAGARREMLGASYAMAETTFAATQTRPGAGPRILRLDRAGLARGVAVPADGGGFRDCVSSGSAIRGCTVFVMGEDGQELPPGRVGELAIRSDWSFDGYRNNPAETAAVLRDGLYFTGDLGFIQDGECYVIGRKKDIIIVAGKNIYPEDIEDALLGVEGVLPGRAVAFGLVQEAMGTEEICVVVETELKEEKALHSLKKAIVKAGVAVDVTISKVLFVPPRWLIKSSAGKPSRKANRQRCIEQFLAPEKPVDDI